MLPNRKKIEIYRTIILPAVLYKCETYIKVIEEQGAAEDMRA
jgi:hypothetical protein